MRHHNFSLSIESSPGGVPPRLTNAYKIVDIARPGMIIILRLIQQGLELWRVTSARLSREVVHEGEFTAARRGNRQSPGVAPHQRRWASPGPLAITWESVSSGSSEVALRHHCIHLHCRTLDPNGGQVRPAPTKRASNVWVLQQNSRKF